MRHPAVLPETETAGHEALGVPAPLEQVHQPFETLLADLSATFVNLPANGVDSQIESALERLVTYLGVDRGGLAQLQPDQKRLAITHSYHRPGVPPETLVGLDEHLPW